MAEIRLGRVFLGWCDECNLPLLGKKCSICGSEARKIGITPPGDYRPAFPAEKERLEEVLRERFCVDMRLDYPLIFNKIPDIDMMREVIWKGRVIGTLRFDIFSKRELFLPRACFAQDLIDAGTDKYVVADDGALSSIMKSSNLLSPGVVGKGRFEPGDEVIVVDGRGKTIATGSARVCSESIPDRGTAVKVRSRGERERANAPGYGFEECKRLMIKSNEEHIENRVKESKDFIRKVIEEKKLPVACSVSGGKDSTATLLLLLESGVRPKILFTDTGLEFEETIDTVHSIAKESGLELLEKSARTDFFEDLGIFGNSSRDYRWCCKTRKMAPMVGLIEENFPKGVLTFIGQRSYESKNRAEHGSVWTNPWLKKQTSASPIQEWNAMEVWLYLFSRNAPYNPLYDRGFERIGCWLCPASDLYDFEIYQHRDYERYMEYLREHYDEKSMALGLWRFRKAPSWAPEARKRERKDKSIIDDGPSIIFSAPEERVRNLALAAGLTVEGTRIRVDSNRDTVRKIVYKAKYCAGCGLCESACGNRAISIKEKKAWIDAELCTSCGSCLDYLCPAVEYVD